MDDLTESGRRTKRAERLIFEIMPNQAWCGAVRDEGFGSWRGFVNFFFFFFDLKVVGLGDFSGRGTDLPGGLGGEYCLSNALTVKLYE